MKIEPRTIAIDKVFKRRDRYDIPDWQREEVWDLNKKQQLIDSILQGWKLPKFYFQKTSDEIEEYEVVDGQQRLQAIWDFFDNSLSLSGESQRIYKARYYRDLPDALSDKFDDFEIQYDEITDATDEEVKEFFQRLQRGLPLTGSEKLNAIHSNLRNFCRNLSKHKFFTEKVAFADKRYSYFDVVAKVTCVEIEGLETGLRFDDIKAVFESHKSFSEKSAVAKQLYDTFNYLERVFPNHSSVLRNRSITQSFATLAFRLVKTGRSNNSEKDFYSFVQKFVKEWQEQIELGLDATDQDYILFQQSVSANVRGGAKIRHEVLLRKMLQIAPSLTRLFEPAIVAESGITIDITNKNLAISKLIEKINTAYAYKTGENLFKPTNKTVAAQRKIGRIISDYSSYKDFIENLYFLFQESYGERLKDKEPQSFKDINILRTDLEHDVDHGRIQKIKAKRRNLLKTFNKYSGGATPTTFAPNLFPVMQVNLLKTIERDLNKILKDL